MSSLQGQLFDTKESYFRGAEFSPCRRYRYSLERRWDDGVIDVDCRRIMFIGLNPSVADENQDDRTIRRLVGFSKSWGYNAFVICNVFGFVTPDPSEMLKQSDPVGPCNNQVLTRNIERSQAVVACWGNHCPLERQRTICELIEAQCYSVYCFRTTKANRPEHPLYLPKTLKPIEFNWRKATK